MFSLRTWARLPDGVPGVRRSSHSRYAWVHAVATNIRRTIATADCLAARAVAWMTNAARCGLRHGAATRRRVLAAMSAARTRPPPLVGPVVHLPLLHRGVVALERGAEHVGPVVPR